ncbi:MAG: nicotinate (nicotinamide) nucleotide adenylyltransferase [Thermodesulfobacteriota bacterium]
MAPDIPEHIHGRIGVLGGTFDPVHHGHLAVARAVRRAMALDWLLLVPAFLPPHKLSHNLAPFAHRLAMLELAAAGEQGMAVSPIEGKRLGPSFSIDTLASLHGQLGSRGELFFVIGMDAFAEIASWKQYLGLLDHAHLVVVARPDQCGQSCGQVVAASFPGYYAVAGVACWRHKTRPHAIHAVAMEPVAVSSSAIRESIRQGKAIAAMVPPAVAAFIGEHRLY